MEQSHISAKEQQVLDFIARHGRCTGRHLAHHFGKKEGKSHCGYIAMLKRMEKKQLVREVVYLPHQRNFVLYLPNPRFPEGEVRPVGEQGEIITA